MSDRPVGELDRFQLVVAGALSGAAGAVSAGLSSSIILTLSTPDIIVFFSTLMTALIVGVPIGAVCGNIAGIPAHFLLKRLGFHGIFAYVAASSLICVGGSLVLIGALGILSVVVGLVIGVPAGLTFWRLTMGQKP